jgi:hypothetical protein
VLGRAPPPGTPVTTRAAAQRPASRDDIRQVAFVQEPNLAQLIELARLADQGHLHPHAGAAYPLARAAEAYSAKAAGGIPGRIVLSASSHELPGPAVHPPAYLPISKPGSADPPEPPAGTPRHNTGQKEPDLPLQRGPKRQHRQPGTRTDRSRATVATSDRYAARLAFQSASALIADSA